MFLYLLLAFGFWLLAEMKSPRSRWDSGTWMIFQIGLEGLQDGGVVDGEGAETDVEELAFTATGGMTIEETDVHATAVMGGSGVSVGFGMTRIKCPKISVCICQINGVSGVGSFGRGLAGVCAVVAVVMAARGIADGEIAENILAEIEAR